MGTDTAAAHSLWQTHLTRARHPRDAAAAVVSVCLALFCLVPDSGIPKSYYFTSYAITIAALALTLESYGRRIRVPATTWLVAAFYFLLVCSSLAANDANAAIRSAATGGVSVLIALTVSCITPSGRILVERVIITIALFETAVALFQKFRGVPVVWGYLGVTPEAVHGVNPIWSPLTGRSLGTLSHPIPLALVIGIALILTFSSPGIRSFIRLPLAAALFAGLSATGTRSAVVSAVLIIVLMALVKVRGRYRWFGRAFLAAALTVFLVRANIRDLSVFTSLDGTISLTNRVGAFGVFVDLFKGPPAHLLFGQGRSGTAYLAAQQGLASTVVAVIDNNFVTVTVITGLTGLALTLALCALPFRDARDTNLWALLFLIAMFFSFDVFLWQIGMTLFLFFAATRSRKVESSLGSPQGSMSTGLRPMR